MSAFVHSANAIKKSGAPRQQRPAQDKEITGNDAVVVTVAATRGNSSSRDARSIDTAHGTKADINPRIYGFASPLNAYLAIPVDIGG